MRYGSDRASERVCKVLHQMMIRARDKRDRSPAHEFLYQTRKRQLYAACYGMPLRQIHLIAVRANQHATWKP